MDHGTHPGGTPPPPPPNGHRLDRLDNRLTRQLAKLEAQVDKMRDDVTQLQLTMKGLETDSSKTGKQKRERERTLLSWWQLVVGAVLASVLYGIARTLTT